MRVNRKADGSVALLFLQGGGAFPLKKIETASSAKPALQKPTVEQLQAYAGVYALGPNFDLKVFVQNDSLMAQATGQGAFEVEAKAADQFSADAYGIEIHFERDASGNVKSLQLLQAGHITPAIKKIGN